MSDEEKKAPKPNPLDGAFIEILERIATESDVSMQTLRLAIHEQSYEKNSARRRIGKTLAAWEIDTKDLRKRLVAHDKKHQRI